MNLTGPSPEISHRGKFEYSFNGSRIHNRTNLHLCYDGRYTENLRSNKQSLKIYLGLNTEPELYL